MATTKQQSAARQNIKKAQAKWKSMSSRQHSLAQPEGRKRAKPGTKGTGDYFRIVVRPKEQFTSFRNHDVGKPGGLQRVAGHRSSGSWSTQAWLISKDNAHIKNNQLIADSKDAKDLLSTLSSKPVHEKGDVFIAKDRRNVPEKEKPTPAQKRARATNIKKAQAARHA
ncbi:MAG TPA: hypothetical protein VH234_05230 [Candidatus Saccharimonadales bacterium]|jgi:hypothetical protein|nr:hypothetical protein [Candidatus Saccharimonadales bacterium]